MSHRLLPLTHRHAVLAICDALAGIDEPWAITGSVSHRLQGVHVTPHDIDIQTTSEGARQVFARLGSEVRVPLAELSSEFMRSVLGSFTLGGIIVEVMGDIQKKSPDGDWEAPTDIVRHRTVVLLAGHRVPVLNLEYEAEAYERIGRHERSSLLREHLHQLKNTQRGD
jgi:hypothetical protein